MHRLAWPLAVLAALFVLAPGALAAMSDHPDDPYFTAHDQWALAGSPASINAPAAWCASTGAGILVADVDTGADFSHPDLAGKLVAGDAFLNGTGQPSGSGVAAVSDDNGHGTMTTGLIVADTNNGAGIASVAPGAKALIVKAIDSSGSANDNDVSAGIEWAVDHGARVINLSLGSDIPLTGDMSSMTSAIDYAYRHGAAVALAAGNNSLPLTDYQISQIANEALVVGALGPTGGVAWYSTSGLGVNIYAPGGDDTYGNDVRGEIVSTQRGGGYGISEGTSFAAPHAAGVLALLMAQGMNNVQARQRVLDTADMSSGLPQLDAARAVGGCAGASAASVRGTTPAPRPSTYTPAATGEARAARGSLRTAPPSSARAAVSVSSPSATASAPSVRAAAPLRGAGRAHSRPWTLLALACAAFAAALCVGAVTILRR
jgi:subtilisin family serine protease